MVRKKLIKIVTLGLCISAFYTGVAFAQSTEGSGSSSVSSTSASQGDNGLFDKQSEIDQYIFKEHAKDIEKKGFQVVYTGVVNDAVEIGITPYSKEAADYLYDIFGKDGVNVIKGEDTLLYTTQIAPDMNISENSIDPAAPDTAVTNDNVDKGVAADAATVEANDGRVYKGSGEMYTMEEPFVEESQLEDPSMIYQTTAPDMNAKAADVAVVSAQDKSEVAGSVVGSQFFSLPVVILAAVLGTMLIGAFAVFFNKRKELR